MDHDERVLADRRKALEEAFFQKQNEKLKAKARAGQEREESRRDLLAAYPNAGPELLDRLLDQGLDVEAVAALGLVPAVMVAWANGRAGDREREAVLAAAREIGLHAGTKPYVLLAGWLAERPSPSLMELWSHYAASICKGLEPDQKARLRDRVVEAARLVAQATGGFLGVGKISEAEEAVIRGVEDVFRA
jgi:hypothetical protein